MPRTQPVTIRIIRVQGTETGPPDILSLVSPAHARDWKMRFFFIIRDIPGPAEEKNCSGADFIADRCGICREVTPVFILLIIISPSNQMHQKGGTAT